MPLEVGAALTGIDVVVAIFVALGVVTVLKQTRLAVSVAGDRAAASDTPQEAVLQIDQAEAAELGAAQGGVRIPTRRIGPIGDVGPEQPQRLAGVIGVVVAGGDFVEHLVV